MRTRYAYLIGALICFSMVPVLAQQYSCYGCPQMGNSQSTNQGYSDLEISLLKNETLALNKIIHNQQTEINLLQKMVSK